MTATYSIRSELGDATVLITGASGFVGSLVLESLLRKTDVARVYLLLRPGKAGARQRLAKLLDGPMFRVLRDSAPHKLQLVEVVAGDLLAPGLGLSGADAERLAAEVTHIVHSAACIQLQAPIHDTLAANYEGTRNVLDLALACTRLRSFVHVSSAYANSNQPQGATVEERLYGLGYGGQAADPLALAQDLLNLDRDTADRRAAALCARWGFPYTYALGKFLTEHLVDDYVQRRGLPAGIVRPSFVVSMGGAPLPGFIGNWAGPQGIAAAYAIGLIDDVGAVAFRPMHVYDMVPGDVVADITLAAAAAVSAGAAPAIAAGAAAHQVSPPQAAATGQEAAAGRRPLLVVHATTSSISPVTNWEAWNNCADWVAACPGPFRISTRYPGSMAPDYEPKPRKVARSRRWTGFKVGALCALLRLAGEGQQAARLAAGWAAWNIYNKSDIDRDPVFASHALLALEAACERDQLHDFLLVWRQTTAVVAAGGDKPVQAAALPHSASGGSCGCHTPSSGSGDVVCSLRECSSSPGARSAGGGCQGGSAAPPGRARCYYTHGGLPQPYLVSWNVWALHFFVGVYRKLYGVDVSGSAAARQLRARCAEGVVVGAALAAGDPSLLPPQEVVGAEAAASPAAFGAAGHTAKSVVIQMGGGKGAGA